MLRFTPTNHTRFVTCNPVTDGLNPPASIRCPACGQVDISRPATTWVSKCAACYHEVCWFTPLTVQQLFLQLDARVVVNIGGVGCGKTTASAFLVAMLLQDEPGVQIYAMAPTLTQLERTGVEELGRFFLQTAFVVRNKSTWKLHNGSAIHWYTADDEEKLRGVNAGLIWLIEASGIPEAVFVQTLARLRQDSLKRWGKNKQGEAIIQQDKVQLIVESNPHLGWVRNLVLSAHTVITTPSVRGIGTLRKLARPRTDPENPKVVLDVVAVLQTSLDNPYMSAEFVASQRANAPDQNIADRNLYCDLSFQEGLVFGTELQGDDFACPTTQAHQWGVDGVTSKWVEGLDPGGPQTHNDPTGYILGIVTERKQGPALQIVECWKQAGLNIAEVATRVRRSREKVGWKQEHSRFFVVDPSAKRLNHNQQSYASDLGKYNIYVRTEGINKDIAFGIRRIKLLAHNKGLLIPSYCTELWQELRSYRWGVKVSRELTSSRFSQKPVDKDNHLLDPLRYIVVSLRMPRQDEEMAVPVPKKPNIHPTQTYGYYFSDRYRLKKSKSSKRPFGFLTSYKKDFMG